MHSHFPFPSRCPHANLIKTQITPLYSMHTYTQGGSTLTPLSPMVHNSSLHLNEVPPHMQSCSDVRQRQLATFNPDTRMAVCSTCSHLHVGLRRCTPSSHTKSPLCHNNRSPRTSVVCVICSGLH